MTRPTVMDKSRLAAFVDGELSPEDAAVVVMHLADHPADQTYVDDLTAANAALSEAFAAPLNEPVPQALRAMILGEAPRDTVVAFRAAPARLWGGLGVALAAGLAIAAFLPGEEAVDLTVGPVAADSALHVAIATLPTGEVRRMPDGTEVMILGSVPTPGGYCREVELILAAAERLKAGLVCTAGEGWSVEVIIVEALTTAASAEGFGTAAGDEAESFTPFLDRIGAGPFLTPDDEAAAIARGWAS